MVISKETANGAPCQSCFLFRMFYVLLIQCGMTFVLAGYLTTLDDVTPTRVGHWLQSRGHPWTNRLFYKLGGGRDGIFLITRHSNAMFSLEVTPPQLMLSWKVSSVCFFLFSYNKWALLTDITMAKKTTVQNCRKINMWKLSMGKKREKKTEFPVVFWNCSAYVTMCIISSTESRATAVPDVSDLD